MRRCASLLLLLGLVAPVVAQDAKLRVIASIAKDSKTGIGKTRLLETSKGELLAFYDVGPGVFVTTSTDRGITWTDLAGKPGVSSVCETALGGFDASVDAKDVVTIALATRGDIELRTLRRADAGWSLSEPKTLDAALRVKGPAICTDARGDVWVAYFFNGHEELQGIRVSRTPSGERFGENTGRFNVTWGFGSTVQKLVVWHGRPMLFYSGGSNQESRQIYWTVFDGKRWPRGAVGVGECARA
ncbi:MAG TPA: hypothetical protein VMY39_08605, partial [Planctomycetota bacterium]|nr:hypothetical protein [Planctomycetota bacterium]